MREIYFSNLGKFLLLKKKRLKKIILKLDENGNGIISIPYSLSFLHAEQFLNKEIEWLKNAFQKLKVKKKSASKINIDSEINFLKFKILFKYDKIKRIKIEEFSNIFYISLPEETNLNSPEIKKNINKILKIKSEELIAIKVKNFSFKFNLPVKDIKFKNAKTRWGSCSFDNRINLNIQLIRLPEELIDYVILHELAHTIVKNHSKEFWEFLNTICSNSKNLDKQLKQYSTSLF